MSGKAKILRIGIATREEMRRRTLAIVRGELVPGPGEPKVWFTSLESLAQVLSRPNKLLLATIKESKPASLAELAKLSGRKESNLSRTLHTMERYGLVRLHKRARGRIAPEVTYDRVQCEFPLAA